MRTAAATAAAVARGGSARGAGAYTARMPFSRSSGRVRAAADPAPTRERLMQEALQLMSREGLRGVSLRRIVQAAGASNPSALLYHFGDRETLVREIALALKAWLEPRTLARLEALAGRRYRLREVIEAVFLPLTEMLQEPALGRDAVRFISRLGWDFGAEGQALSAELHRRSFARAVELLRPLLREADEEVLKLRLILTMTTVYHGLPDHGYLWRSPFGALELAKRENAARLQQVFIDHLEAGLHDLR